MKEELIELLKTPEILKVIADSVPIEYLANRLHEYEKQKLLEMVNAIQIKAEQYQKTYEQLSQKLNETIDNEPKQEFDAVSITDFLTATFDNDKNDRLINSYTPDELESMNYGIVIKTGFDNKFMVKYNGEPLELYQDMIVHIPNKKLDIRINSLHTRKTEIRNGN